MIPSVESPFSLFTTWFDQARKANLALPEAFCLSTATRGGRPSSRMVLLKEYDARGFVFFTHYDSRKGRELVTNSRAAACFHWAPLQLQIRIEGAVKKVSRAENVAYFATRPRESQLGAWASPQSRMIRDRMELEELLTAMVERFAGKSVPCPPRWGGFRIDAQLIEFWQGMPGRLHDRVVYTRRGSARSPRWSVSRVAP